MKPQIIRNSESPINDLRRLKTQDLMEQESMSINVVERTQDGKLGIQTASDMYFYVLEGAGKCVLGEEEFQVEKGDLIVIPKGTKYKTFKGLKLLTISTPKFDREKNTYLE